VIHRPGKGRRDEGATDDPQILSPLVSIVMSCFQLRCDRPRNAFPAGCHRWSALSTWFAVHAIGGLAPSACAPGRGPASPALSHQIRAPSRASLLDSQKIFSLIQLCGQPRRWITSAGLSPAALAPMGGAADDPKIIPGHELFCSVERAPRPNRHPETNPSARR
jgi:hypothetical protein